MGGDKISERTLRYRRRSIIVDPSIKQDTEFRTWADLPEDILRVIKSKLWVTDQVRLGAVCKNWRLLGKSVMAMAYFSKYCTWKTWQNPRCKTNLVTKSDPDVSFEIYDTYGGMIHGASYNISGGLAYGKASYNVLASKEGWLLIVDSACSCGALTLYNPFSNLDFSVPILGHDIDVATFSTIPTSSNCVIFVFYHNWGRTHLGTYCFGDKNWTKLIIVERNAAPQALSVVYIEEVLYYVFYDGMLGCFSYSGQYRSILTETFPEHYSTRCIACFHLFESKGQVLLATADKYFNWRIFRFDQSQMTWIAEISLGERALFVSPTSFVVQAVGDQVDLADCICYFDYQTHALKVYSLKDKQWKHPQRKIPRYSRIYFNIKNYLKIWIESPNI